MFYLEQFLESDHLEPSAEDYTLLRQILAAAQKLPAEASAQDLEKALGKIIPSNRYQRDQVLEILGYCGILQSRYCLSYRKEFVDYEKRTAPSGAEKGWAREYPLRWWRGADGVNLEAVAFWFPELKLS